MLHQLSKNKEIKILPTDSLDEAFAKYVENPRSNVRVRAGVFAGGGAKGLISLVMARSIERLQEKTNKERESLGKKRIERSFIDTLDTVAGTSTGAIIACLLALRKSTDSESPDFKKPKYSVNDVIKIYLKCLPKIFGPQNLALVKAFKPPFTKEKFKAITKGFYTQDGLIEVLEELGLKDIEFNRKNFLIPVTVVAGNLLNKKPLIFKTEDWLNGTSNKLSDVLLSSTAAAPYLPAHAFKMKVRNKDGSLSEVLVRAGDGAFYDNSPTSEMFSDIVSPEHPVIGKGGRFNINNGVSTSFTLIVFGTGNLDKFKEKMQDNIVSNIKSGISLLLSSSGKISQKLLKAVFQFYNDKHIKDRQSASRFVMIDAEMDKPMSLISHSKKSLKTLCKCGIRAARSDDVKKKLEKYVGYDFAECILRKCDRDMQKYIVNEDEFQVWHKNIQEEIIDLEVERSILLSNDKNQEHEYLSLAEERKIHDIQGFAYSEIAGGKCKQREFKRAVEYLVKMKSALKESIDILHAQNALSFDGYDSSFPHSLRDEEMASESKWALTSRDKMFRKVFDPSEQANMYITYFNKIKESNPELIPDEKSSVMDRVKFSREVVRRLHVKRCEEDLNTKENYCI